MQIWQIDDSVREIFPAQTTSLTADGWLPQVACLRSLMKWGGSFSTWQNISCPSQSGFWMLSISSRAVCHADRRQGSWDSHRVAVIVLATAAWMTPVTREGFYSQGRWTAFPKMALLWLVCCWHWNKTVFNNGVALFTCKHLLLLEHWELLKRIHENSIDNQPLEC